MDLSDHLTRCTGFQWDEGNLLKIWQRHHVSAAECEQLFFNRSFVTAPDIKHSATEQRFYALGQSDEGRRLFVVFTIRGDLIRVVTARDMNRRERRVYEKL
jgi:hypothetical protein